MTLLSYDTSAAGASKTATEAAKVTLKGGATYESTPAGLTLNLPADGFFNKVAPNGTVASNATKIKDTATKGSIEPDGNTVLTVRVKGPFKAVMLCASNSDDKSGRYAYIKIGDTEYAPNKEANTLYQVGEEISAVYTEDDEVEVAFGGTDVVRIHDIQITTANGDAEGKTAGKVTSLAEFEPGEPVTVTFEELNLESDATAKIDEGDNVVSVEKTSEGIKISAIAPGTVKITVTVGGDGEIKATVKKYVAPGETVTYKWLASEQTGISSKTSVVTTLTDSTGAKSLDFGPELKIDGTPQRFNFGGSLQATKNYFKIEVPDGGANLKILFYSSSADRYLICKKVTDDNGGTLTFGDTAWTGTKTTTANSAIYEEELSLASGTYAIGSASNGIYITEIDVTM